MVIERWPVPVNEDGRLKALDSYDILDTIPEAEYDALTRLASYICQVPLAFISFIDGKRQWFKSTLGLTIDEVPRADSFCRYTIMSDNLVEVEDACMHEIFSDSESVKGEFGIRFYASAPLIDPDGHRLGSLCIFDHQPKILTADQRDALQTLASEVMSHLAIRKQKKELEFRLRQHEDFFTLFNSSSEIHFIADEDSKIEHINNATDTILGYKPHQLIGHSLWEFVVGQNRDQFAQQIEIGQHSHRSFEIETCVVAKNGEEKCISWSAINHNGKWYASGRDVTEHKKVQAQLEQLSLVASKVSNGVAITDANNRIIWTNEAFKNITGYNFADLSDRQMGDVFKGDYNDPKINTRIQDLLKTERAFEVEVKIEHKDGHLMWLSVTNSPVVGNNGKVDRYIKILLDITARKNAESDLEILSFASAKSPSGVVIRDKDGVILWMNESLERILGYSLDELKGKTFGNMLIGKNTDLRIAHQAKQAYDQNTPYEVEIQLYKKDGTPVWVLLSNSPFFNNEGQLERQVTVCADVNERKLAENQLTMLSLVASSTVSGVIINNSEGKVEWVNAAFETITGFNLEEVKDLRLGDALKGELTDYSIIEKMRVQSKNKQSFEVDVLAYRKDREPIWLTVINSVILDDAGAVSKYIEVIIDITARKNAEQDLVAAKEEALQLSRAKDMFISVMSHEIRTPLNAVIGMSHLLSQDNIDESQTENLNILKFSAENLMTLINDVLDFTKIETGNIELEQTKVDLRDLVHSVASSMQFKAADHHIYFKEDIAADVPECILADRTRLVQILLNLVGNAVKFTEQGGVTIQLSVADQTAHEVKIRFAVNDTGIGIAANKIDTIFESFKQADADTTRKYGGTGLGLAITKRLIELHHSNINVESTPGEGSSFWFEINFKKANNTIVADTDGTLNGLNMNVLVVDDNQINRLLINKVLKKWGILAEFAENGVDAVEKVTAKADYDVVLMDIHMPVMGGLEATGIIRSKEEEYFKKLPIIALTASMLSNQLGEIKESGMDDFILKPFDPKNLYDKLSRYQKQ